MAETILRLPSLNRLAKNPGIVMESSNFSVKILMGLAIYCQLKKAPMVNTIAIQLPLIPVKNINPGSPSKSQPLISEAPADSAATTGFNPLPPKT